MGLAERDPEKARAAQLVRRTSLRVAPDAVSSLSGLERVDAVQRVLNVPLDGGRAPVTDKSDDALKWWLGRIASQPTGLQDRMMFFWHSVIPTHRYAVGKQELLATQMNMVRENALGNFRTLLQAFMIDGGMIRYLDANSSTGKKPNENLARELMELFTVGVGFYSEKDVKAAALAMSGWNVDNDSLAVSYDPERGYTEPVTFFGQEKVWDLASIVDHLCDQTATASRIAGKMWYHFVGSELSGEEKTQLGIWWQEQNLEIKPLIGKILMDDRFWADHYARPRMGFEFYTALAEVLKLEPDKLWQVRNLGQMPWEPPNVGGWPVGSRWLNPDALLRRSEVVVNYDYKKAPGGLETTVEEILDRCGLWVVSDETMAAIESVNGTDQAEGVGEDGPMQLKWRIVLSSPEFQLQ